MIYLCFNLPTGKSEHYWFVNALLFTSRCCCCCRYIFIFSGWWKFVN